MAGSRQALGPAEAARRLGISGKALRVYEAHGLIRPERTPAGWRVYGPEQMARLHQVLALRSFGLSLGRIAELLGRGHADLAGFLALHEDVLRQRRERIELALALVAAARGKLAERGSLSPDDLIDLTRRTLMNDVSATSVAAAYEAAAAKHLSAADRAALDANAAAGMAAPDPDWAALNAEAARLMATSAPSSPEAIDLARRWMTKVFAATGGDPALTRKVKAVAHDFHEHPAVREQAPAANAIMDYVAAAYGEAIAAGVMPPP